MISKKLEQDIIDAYKKGTCIKNIEKQLNTNAPTIYRVLKRNNIAKTNLRQPHTEETKQKMSNYKSSYWENKKKEMIPDYEGNNGTN